ncbi:Csu type fimbrial protein [Intestinirhabdus alba]|jgi:spore coat protein U-like protein|uniref:Fimbrial major subunit CsuA/B family protein n=1 Tax=Intestinirhabdus alba TaxID=2899544 RepID=A0A6L6IDA5_9ENTR|nr:spore coat U domain-containing protein [Intestinirhabdus alba]MTH44701.1 fimbrial major subunit CsuA/B family protein [Intestinirhabdus alba]
MTARNTLFDYLNLLPEFFYDTIEVYMIRTNKIAFVLCTFVLLANTEARAATTATANMDVTLTVEPSCLLSVDPLNFGTHTIGDTGVASQTNATVTCTAGTPYILTSDNSHTYTLTNPSGTAGSNTVPYTLYLDAAGTLPLAQQLPDDTGVAASSTIGTGSAQPVPIYGRIADASMTGIGAGTYTDTVTLQLTY